MQKPRIKSRGDNKTRDDEYDYQRMLKGLELKRDMETILLYNQAYSAGAAATARKLGSIDSWLGTNTVFESGSSGADPTSLDGSVARTDDGTPVAFTEARLKTSLQEIWTSGGKPDTIYVG